MSTLPMKLVTIVAPESSEGALVEGLAAIGVNGCSMLRARGRGVHGVRPGGWGGAGLDWHGPNVQIEAVVDAAIVDRVLAMLETRLEVYGPIVAWTADVEAWPREHLEK